MKTKTIKFLSAKVMVNWLMDNESEILFDSYGRAWFYENYKFYTKDIGSKSEFKEGLFFLHLHKSTFAIHNH